MAPGNYCCSDVKLILTLRSYPQSEEIPVVSLSLLSLEICVGRRVRGILNTVVVQFEVKFLFML